LRNRLLIYRLIHYHDPIRDIDVGYMAREKQLWKPLLRVFQNTSTFVKLKQVALEFIRESREQKSHSHTAFIVNMILDLIEENTQADNRYKLGVAEIWKKSLT